MRKILLIFILFTSSQAWSEYTSMENYMDSWSIAFGVSQGGRVVNHSETSSEPSFTSVGKEITIEHMRFSLSVQKEFGNANRISFTVSALGGISSGSFEDTSLNQKEDLQSIHFGGGLSINYNAFYQGLKLQPYIGVDFLQEQGKLNLSHDAGVVNVIHQFSETVAIAGVGLRAFDVEVGLMSYLQVGTAQQLGQSLTPQLQANGGELPITSQTTVERQPVVLSLGFGAYF